MRFLYVLLAFLLISKLVHGTGDKPVIGPIQLIPNLSIDHFDDYEVSVDIEEPNGVVVTSVTATVTPWNVQQVINGTATETISWNYFADGTAYGNDPIVKPMTKTGTKWHYDDIRPDDIYPEIFFVPSSHAYSNPPSEVLINQNNYPIMPFKNPFQVGEGTGFFIEFYAEPVSLSGPPSVDLQVYLVAKGKTIDFFKTDWMNDQSVALVGTINRNDVFSHNHGTNSNHHLVALSFNEIVDDQGIIAVGDKKLDITGDFWIVLYAPTHLASRSWRLKYHNYTPPTDVSTPWYFGDAEKSSVSPVPAPNNQAPDMHVHFARNTTPNLVDGIKTEVEVEYTYNGTQAPVYAEPKFFTFGTIPDLPPNASSFVNPPPGLYSGSVDIGWLPVTDPNNNLSSYSIYLYDDNLESDVYTVAEGIGPATTTYSFDTTGGPVDGGYNIRIKACDNTLPTPLCATFFLYDNYVEGTEFVIANNLKTWTGASSGSWNVADNWSPVGEPGIGELVHIPATVTNTLTIPVSIDASVKRLQIETDGQLTIAPGGTLTVSEALVNNAGAANLVVEAGGSLLHQSAWPSINVAATVNHTISSGNWSSSVKSDQNGWHLLTSPVAEQAISEGFTPSESGYDFFGWDEGIDKWINQKQTKFSTWNGGNNFVPGRGYLVSYQNNASLTFSGGLNLQDVAMTGLTLTAHDPAPYYESGWHLVGNPYASGLNWGNTKWVKTNLAASAKIWDDGGYVDVQIDLNYMIPALQGFFVQVTEAPGSITIPSKARQHGGTWQKNSDAPHMLLVASANGSQLRQRSVLRTTPDGGIDYNSRFLAGDAPMFYSIHNGQRFSTRSLDQIDEETVIPFGFERNHEGDEFSIALEASIPGTTPYLIDRKLNREHQLGAGNPYVFTSVEGDDPQRFELWFTTAGLDPTSIGRQEECLARIYANDKLLMLEFHEPVPGRQLEVFDLSGRRLLHLSIGETATQHQQHLNLNPGIYLVRLTDSQNIQTEKIIITR